MGFVVLPALPADTSAVYDAYFSAFKNNPVTKALFPYATEEDMLNSESAFRKGHTAHTLKWIQESATTQYTLKCIDTTTNTIVGMALWDVYLTPSDWAKGEISWLSGAERTRAEALINPLWDAREKLWNKEKYVYGHVIAVRPEYQKMGVGKLLVEAGVKIAEQAGLPIYVESSKEGVRLYENAGFRRLTERLRDADGQENQDVPLLVWVPEGREDVLPKAVVLA